MRLKIETSRLILRPFELTDAEAAFGWFGSPVVMRFTPTGPDSSIGQTKTRGLRLDRSWVPLRTGVLGKGSCDRGGISLGARRIR